MLHSPISETKTKTAQSKIPVVPQPERELHPALLRPAGLYSSSEMNGTASGSSSIAQRRPALAGMQSAHGNQAVLRMMRSPQQVMRMTPLRPSQGVMLQRKCACGGSSEAGGECAECKAKEEGMLQRRAANAHASPSPAQGVPPIVHEVLRSPGLPLDAGTRAFMEPRFGHDFSGVRVHTDAKAAESARAVNALAYTVGRNVVFGAGQHAQGASEGRRLMVHELTHVVQQGVENIHTPLKIALADNAHEREADVTAQSVVSGSNGEAFLRQMSSSSSVLQRQTASDDDLDQMDVEQEDRKIPVPAPMPGVSPPPSTILGNTPMGVGPIVYDKSNFDNRYEGVVYPQQGLIVLRMGVKFEREGPGWLDPITKAPTAESEAEAQKVLQKFAGDFKTVVEQAWSYQYDLKSACVIGPSQYHAKVKIDVVNENPDITIYIYRDMPGGRSNADTNAALQESDNTYKEYDWKYRGQQHEYYQIPSVHEFGHLIGLTHIHCNTNDVNCYGVTPEESMDVMGRGSYVSARDYEPFKRIAQRYGNDYTPPSEVGACNQWQIVGVDET